MAYVFCFRMPWVYYDRLMILCEAEDWQLNDRWNGFIPSLVNEWTRLSVVVSRGLSLSGPHHAAVDALSLVTTSWPFYSRKLPSI